MACNHSPKIDQLFYLACTCLNNMFYNRHIESEHRRRTAHPSADRPHNKKVGERIHGACKRRPHARLISARTIRNRRLWLECLRLCRFPRLVQTTLLADSALTTTSYGDSPYQSFSAARNPNFIDFAELIERVSGAARYRRRVPGLRSQQCRLRCYLCWPPPNPRPRRRALRRE